MSNKKPKYSKMRKTAIVLFILQILVYAGGIINGSLEKMGVFEIIGYSLLAIIGTILLIKDIVNQKRIKANDKRPNPPTPDKYILDSVLDYMEPSPINSEAPNLDIFNKNNEDINNIIREVNIMFCQKCGKEVNDEAVICIGCGCPVLKPVEEETPRKPPLREYKSFFKHEKIWLTISATLFFISVIFLILAVGTGGVTSNGTFYVTGIIAVFSLTFGVMSFLASIPSLIFSIYNAKGLNRNLLHLSIMLIIVSATQFISAIFVGIFSW